MKIDIAIKDTDRKKVAEALAHLLADTYLLYLKTQNFHWNVISPNFPALHKLFEEQYEELAAATDEIAERIRALGLPTPASFTQFLKLTCLKEVTKELSDKEMLKNLLSDHEAIITEIRKVNAIADAAGDEGTADLFAVRLRSHEKTAWMLRSSL